MFLFAYLNAHEYSVILMLHFILVLFWIISKALCDRCFEKSSIINVFPLNFKNHASFSSPITIMNYYVMVYNIKATPKLQIFLIIWWTGWGPEWLQAL